VRLVRTTRNQHHVALVAPTYRPPAVAVDCSPLAVLPTPVHRAPRLERALGIAISVAVDRARAGPVV
jgi:hypothetical protein